MVNHIHVHRANVDPLFGHPIMVGQAATPPPKDNPNTNTNTGTSTGTGAAATPKTGTGTTLTPTGDTPTPDTSTTTTGTTTTTDGGILSGLVPTHVTTTGSAPTSNTTTTFPSSFTTSTTPVPNGVTTAPASGPPKQGSGTQSGVSTVFQTLNGPSTSPLPSLPPSADTSNPDAGPIAGGVIGGLFAVAALGMLISFLLRRRRRNQIDKEILGADIFGGSGYRRSTTSLDEAKNEGLDSDKYAPRPPSIIERRVGTPAHNHFPGPGGAGDPAMFAGMPYGGYGAPPPGYPPQTMQRGYYPQGQQHQPPYAPQFQQPGYNQAYTYNQPQVPSRAHTPQVPIHHMTVQAPRPPSSVHDLPNPYGARSDAGHGGHDANVESGAAAAMEEKRRSGQSDYGHRPSEELPAYGYGLDDTNYAELHRDSKPKPDSVDLHGVM